MRSRLAIVLIVAAALVTAGCGSGGGEITAKGDPAPVAGGGSTDSGSGGSDAGASDPSLDPNLDPGALPGMLGAEECLALSLAIGAGAAAALAGPEEIAQIEAELDKVRDSIPTELQADIDTVTGAFKVLQEEGLIAAGEAMSSPEVTDAQNRLQAYLTENCGG